MASFQGIENFGGGELYLVPSSGVGGEKVGILRDVSVSWKASKKPLKGGQTYALANAVTDQSFEGKCSSASFQGNLVAAILGATPAVGESGLPFSESITVAATVSPTKMGTTFGELLTIRDVAGKPMTLVASAPAAGQYAIVTAPGATKGQITLAAAEPVGKIAISYTYTSAATGQSFTIANRTIAAPTTFKMVLAETYAAAPFSFTLNAITIDSWDFNGKSEDWSDCSFTFSAQADAAGNIGVISYNRV